MKKKWLFLCSVICALALFTACSDDDEGGSGNWDAIWKTYEGRDLNLILGENVVPIYGKSVVVKALEANATDQSAQKAAITLNNVIPENKEVVVEVNMQKSEGAFAFAGETTMGACALTVNGTIKDGAISMVSQRKLSAPVVGDWKLKYTKVSSNDAAVVYTKVKTAKPEIDLMIQSMAGPVIGQLLAKKVELVQVNLPEKGTVGISWKKVGEEKVTNIDEVLEIVNLQYCPQENRFLLVIDKNFIEVLTTLGKELIEQKGIQVDELLKLFVDMGGYYAVPLNTKIEGNTATFYAEKDLLVPVISILMPLIQPMIPAGFEDTIKGILALLPTAETLEIGLTFER